MTILSTKGAENIEKALESIKEKDLKLNEDGIISGELIINDYEEN